MQCRMLHREAEWCVMQLQWLRAEVLGAVLSGTIIKLVFILCVPFNTDYSLCQDQ